MKFIEPDFARVLKASSKVYMPEALRYYVLSDGKLSDLNIINEVMYHIYKSFMFEWKSIQAIDNFLMSIMNEAKELDLHVLLCLLMATNVLKKKLKKSTGII